MTRTIGISVEPSLSDRLTASRKTVMGLMLVAESERNWSSAKVGSRDVYLDAGNESVVDFKFAAIGVLSDRDANALKYCGAVIY